MSFRDPFRGYDQWLTTDTSYEAQEREYEHLMDQWNLAVDAYDLPVDADEEDHPDHAIYVAWEKFIKLVDEREYRLEVEAEEAEAAYWAANEQRYRPLTADEAKLMSDVRSRR